MRISASMSTSNSQLVDEGTRATEDNNSEVGEEKLLLEEKRPEEANEESTQRSPQSDASRDASIQSREQEGGITFICLIPILIKNIE